MKRTVGQPEQGPEWPRIVARLESVPLNDVAREFGLTPGALAAAMVRSRTSRKAVIPRRSDEPVEAVPAESTRPTPVPDPAPEFFPPEPTAPARPLGKLDTHLAGYRSAVETGGGRAFLVALHQLVRGNLRARIAGAGDVDLLARYDADAPASAGSSVAAAPRPTAAARRSERTSADDGRQAPQQPVPDRPTARARVSHVYVVTALLDGVRHDYGVVGDSMASAVSIAVRALGAGVVVAVAQGLPALE